MTIQEDDAIQKQILKLEYLAVVEDKSGLSEILIDICNGLAETLNNSKEEVRDGEEDS